MGPTYTLSPVSPSTGDAFHLYRERRYLSWTPMAQEAILDQAIETEVEEIHEALAICESCSHLVPKTMVCLYCGAPILFKEPKRPDT